MSEIESTFETRDLSLTCNTGPTAGLVDGISPVGLGYGVTNALTRDCITIDSVQEDWRYS